ncbi:hypothetical protein C9374_008165 [Naegleria lovaniensis]|uniref:Uncharacterized protein n=1 Tax=Naegleria lovaniensis TaxID=51637 RepID=A0AA88GJV6_NAELO|nr:uncharacterized protein C9374_008165 [Naegleria lovaniensis]KAG2378526.1 hypothetical protein C9374_008165 [Naegleria lovaniensis]
MKNGKRSNRRDDDRRNLENALDLLEQLFSLIDMIQVSFSNIYKVISIPIQYVGRKIGEQSSKIGSNVFDTLLDLFTPVQTLFDQYQTYYGYYRGATYFNPNELFVTRVFNYFERIINNFQERVKKTFTEDKNVGFSQYLLKTVIIGGLFLVWRALYIWWRFKKDASRSSQFNSSNFIDGNVIQSFVDNESLSQHLQNRKEWEQLRRNPFSHSTSDLAYLNSPQYHLQSPYFPLRIGPNERERNFFTYFPSYRNRVEDLEFREDTNSAPASLSSNINRSSALYNNNGIGPSRFYNDMLRNRTLIGLRRNNTLQRENIQPYQNQLYSSISDNI